jgi:hypothetical protein
MSVTEEGTSFFINELIIPEGFVFVGAASFGYKAGNLPVPAPRREGTLTIIR